MKSDQPITVYYNSACPVCDAGIRNQRQRMELCNVEWVDVHADPSAVQDLGTELEAVRERLHVRRADGSVAVGDAAFAELLAHTPRWRWLGTLVRWLHVIVAPLYNMIARRLYAWNRRRGHW
jgi:predicted DCC family thiol-disulfide oxidoreductase YuxK